MWGSPSGMPHYLASYCTFAVTDAAAFIVRVQLFCLAPPLEQAPDQMASRPLVTASVTAVPVAKLAVPVVPTATFSPAGLEKTDSPDRPVALKVSAAVDVVPPPHTLATPPPPQVWGAVQVPQVSVPPQPSEIVPQFFPCAAQVVGVHAFAGFTVRTAVTVPESWAAMVAEVEVCTADVATANAALVWPAGMTTLDGTLATALLLERNAAAPPDGAAMFNPTVPTEELPPVTELGLRDSDETAKVDDTVHTPPPHVCPVGQPHVSVPPQPSENVPHADPKVRHVFGAQPAVTISGLVSGA